MKERNTKQKQAVYEALCALGHPTATEVYDCVHRRYPTISRGTVFRVLGGFAENGRAQKIRFSENCERFDATTSPHFHVRCRSCGKIADLFSSVLLKALSETDTGDFTAEGCNVEFSGICAECKKIGDAEIRNK